jgi:hypothetical protein
MLHIKHSNTNLAVGNSHSVAKKLHHHKEHLEHEKQAKQKELDAIASVVGETSHSDKDTEIFESLVGKSLPTKKSMPNARRHPLSASALQAKFNARLLDSNELEVLCSYYEDSAIDDEFESLSKKIEDCDEGQELSILNGVFEVKEISNAQKYYLLMFLHQKLKQNPEKENFSKTLQSYILQFEEQNSGYLFEFFSLIDNDKVTKQFSPDAIDALASINSAELNINDLRTCINVIEQISGNDFSHIISLYMQSRVHQLRALKAYTGSHDDKSKLYELLSFERNLVQIHSLYLIQNDFIAKKSS